MQETLLSATSHARPTQQPGAGQVPKCIEVRTGSWNEKTKRAKQSKQAHLCLLTSYYLFTPRPPVYNQPQTSYYYDTLSSTTATLLVSMMMLIPLAPRLLPIAGAWRVALMMMSDPLLNLFLLTSPLRRTRSVHLATTSCSIRGAKGGRRRLVGRRQRRTDGRPAGPSCASLLTYCSPVAHRRRQQL